MFLFHLLKDEGQDIIISLNDKNGICYWFLSFCYTSFVLTDVSCLNFYELHRLVMNWVVELKWENQALLCLTELVHGYKGEVLIRLNTLLWLGCRSIFVFVITSHYCKNESIYIVNTVWQLESHFVLTGRYKLLLLVQK